MVGLRDQGDQAEIFLRRDRAVTVLDSATSDADTVMRFSLRSFSAVSNLGGFVLVYLPSYGWGNLYYYAIQSDAAICFAQSFGGDIANVARGLDGAGQARPVQIRIRSTREDPLAPPPQEARHPSVVRARLPAHLRVDAHLEE